MAEEHTSPGRLSPDLLRERLSRTFAKRPEYTPGVDGGAPSIPAKAIIPLLDDCSAEYGIQILKPDTARQFENFSASAPDIPITVDDILNFIAEFTAASPSATSPQPEYGSPEKIGSLTDAIERGRTDDRDTSFGSSSRSSSNDSVVTSYYRPEDGRRSRRPSVPNTPQTAQYAVQASPFDSHQRQRAVPLNAPPSAFQRKPAAPGRRRKSDSGRSTGSVSDGEGSTVVIPSRRRGSNPVSPRMRMSTSPPKTYDSRSPPSSADNSFVFPSTRPPRSSPPKLVDSHFGHDDFDPDLDFDDDEGGLGDDSVDEITMMLNAASHDKSGSSDSETASMTDMLVRPHVASDASLSTPEERIEALQRVNAELHKKLKDNDRMLLARLQERELEIEDLQGRLEELRTELQTAQKDQKELRQKGRQNTKQLNSFEAEIATLQSQLDTSKQSQQNMLKQYSEQCTISENYRTSLRLKDQQIKDHEKILVERNNDIARAVGEKEILESSIHTMNEELQQTRQAQRELEEQRHENMLLKETIDRLKYDMDVLRADAAAARSGVASLPGTLSKSLANELKNKLMDHVEEDEVEGSLAGDLSMDGTVVSEDHDISRELDDDFVETIITTTRRRGPARQKSGSESYVHVEPIKEYADAYAQHDQSQFTKSAVMQTIPPPAPPVKSSLEIQTDPQPAPPVRITASMETQTEEPDEPESSEPGPSGLKRSDTDEEELSSSVETLRGLSPSSSGFPLDSPPDYYDTAKELERHRLLQKWHPGLHGNASSGVKGGVSATAVREWKNLKKELGFDCVAIDKTLEASTVNGERDEEELDETPRIGGRKFYNIYNTYVLGNGGTGGADAPVKWRDVVMMGIGAGAILLAVGIPMSSYHADIKEYYKLNSFVSHGIEGGPGTGALPYTDAFWRVVQSVLWRGLGAARRVPQIVPS